MESPDSFIRFEGVSRSYQRGPTAVHALRDVDLALPPNTFTAVVGRSGSGKSTLMHVLAAMEQPTAGRITVGPWAVTDLDRAERARYRREAVGMIFQRFNLVPSMTALGNVELPLMMAGVGRAERRARAEAALAQVGLAQRIEHRPDELSGGEQQRVAVARALVHDPPLLLADEPTGNLDSQTAEEIVDLLRAIHREGRSVLVVTHNLAEFRDAAEWVVRLDDGAVAEAGPLADSSLAFA
ncbi:MAG: ABC transporter ATP-binding protein [Rhodothermales bacterium]